MNNKQKDIFFQIHQGMDREGPGDYHSTKRAFLKLIDLPSHPKILDIEKKLQDLRQHYQNDAEALEVIDMEQSEIDLYRKYSKYYGYLFYIMQKL